MSATAREITLNKGQWRGAKKIRNWIKAPYKQLLEVSGGPGTGKTTMLLQALSAVLNIESQVLFVAFMGKATNVMRINGLPAKTIHSTFYEYSQERVYDGEGNLMRRPDGRPMYRCAFDLKGYISNKIKCIVIDEAGMVPDNMLDDILSFGIPVLAVGDKDQLPPVFGSSRLFKQADVILTEIMRQAKGSPIIELAHAIRTGKPIYEGKWGKGVHVVGEEYLGNKKLFKRADVVICGRNSTRQDLNSFIREEVYGIKSQYPVVGDKMVCRKNNWQTVIDGDIPLTNGTYGTVSYINQEKFTMSSMVLDFLPDQMDDCFYDLPIDNSYLFANYKDRAEKSYYGKGNLLEYAYAITCQLAQGSQYDNVVIVEEVIGSKDYHRRWLYTAVTRAKKGLILIRPNMLRTRPKDLYKKKDKGQKYYDYLNKKIA